MDTLFDVEPVPVPPAGPKDSPGVRRTRGQAELLARGVHPLTGQGLHEQAAPADDRDALGRRCGNCRFRRVLDYHARAYPKCLFGATEDYAPRVAHSDASDARRWWPGCRDHEPGDPRVPDGMRWVPDPAVMC